MKTISAAELSQEFNALLEQIATTHEEIAVTKDGRIVARLTPVEEPRRTARGAMAGTSRELGDITEPFDDEWDAMR